MTIFRQETRTSSYNFVSTGVIIGPTTVLTIFNGAYGQRNTKTNNPYSIIPSESIFIIAGTNSSLPTLIDRHSVLRQVNYILPYSGHERRENQDYHYVILHLKEELKLNTPFVRKICLPPLGVPKVVRDASASIYDTKISGAFGPKELDGSYYYGVKALYML